MAEVKQENRVIIRGSIVGMSETTKRATLTVATSGGFDRRTYPNIFFYDRKLVAEYKIKDRVLIFGKLHNHMEINPDTGKKEYQSTPIGEQIFRASRQLLDYYSPEIIKDPNGGAPDDRNEVLMAGRLEMVYVPEQNPNIVIIRVKCSDSEKSGSGQFSCFSKCAAIARKCKAGDFVIVTGYVSTDRKEKNGGIKDFQTIIARDLYKVE